MTFALDASSLARPARVCTNASGVVRALTLLGSIALLACGGDDAVNARASSGDAASQRAPNAPAVLVGVFVRNPDGRNVYVGATPEVPSGELDYSSFLEFGNVDVYTAGGYVFVWERDPATMTRYAVSDGLELSPGPTVSFASFGLSGGGETVFVSERRAYVLSPQLDVIVVWDPVDMVITGTIPVTVPERPTFDSFAFGGVVTGDRVVWMMSSENAEAQAMYPAVTLLVADANSDTPARVIEDERCVGGDGAHVDENGDVYVRANASWGMYAAYGPEASSVHTCMLRLRAAAEAFDPDFEVDFRELTGSYVNGPWFHMEGPRYVAHVWDPAVALPANPDDYWTTPGYRPYLADIEAGTVAPYPDLDSGVLVSSIEFEVDGVKYYQLSRTGSVLNGSAEIVELHADGIRPAFSLPELWALARIR